MFHVKHTRLFLCFQGLRIGKMGRFVFHMKRDGEFHGKMIVSRETSGAKNQMERKNIDQNATNERYNGKKIWHLHEEDAIS